jgi:hypothetical protein
MSFKEAIARDIICDYKILTMAVSDREIKKLIAKNRLLNLSRKLTEAEAREVATGIAVTRIYRNIGLRMLFRFIEASLLPRVSVSNNAISTACHRARKTFT